MKFISKDSGLTYQIPNIVHGQPIRATEAHNLAFLAETTARKYHVMSDDEAFKIAGITITLDPHPSSDGQFGFSYSGNVDSLQIRLPAVKISADDIHHLGIEVASTFAQAITFAETIKRDPLQLRNNALTQNILTTAAQICEGVITDITRVDIPEYNCPKTPVLQMR